MNATNPRPNVTLPLDTILMMVTGLVIGMFGIAVTASQAAPLMGNVWSVIAVSGLGTLPFVGIARIIVQPRRDQP